MHNAERMKKAGKPERFIIQPPASGKRAGRIFPAPAKPVYKALLSLPETSSSKPFMVMVYKE